MLHCGKDSLQDDFGLPIHEKVFKDALLRLNPNLIFDLPGNHALYHPNIERWQNIRLPSKHLSSMDRGWLTEADVWTYDPKEHRPIRVWRIGWRTTLSALNGHKIPGLNWTNFCRELKIQYKGDRQVVFLSPDGETPLPVSRARTLQGWA